MTDKPTKKRTNPDCPICNRPKEYNEGYDSYYCKYCNIWLEASCGNRNCEFCSRRPKNPISLKDMFYGKIETNQGVIKTTRKK